MRVYISGPIAGHPDENRAAFGVVAELLRSIGHDVVNPHEISHEHEDKECARGKKTDRPEDGHAYGCYLVADIVALSRCDAIWALQGWAKSPGARAEMEFARACGIPLFCPDCLEVEMWQDRFGRAEV